MVRPPASDTLYERAREQARIAGRLAEARAGDGGLTVIEGPAGIGKSRLLREVRAQAERMGMQVLAGRGSELEHDFAFGVLRQALERPLVAGDEALDAERLPDGARRVPAFGDRQCLGSRRGRRLAFARHVLEQRGVQARTLIVHRRGPERAKAPCRLPEVAERAGLLRRRAARRDARDPLLAALALARECGADGLAAHAGDELRASGMRVPSRPSSGTDTLTPSERRITGMAAEGATNKEIAQTLFLSVKTVEMHLGHAYRKLDIGSRRELPAAMAAEA